MSLDDFVEASETDRLQAKLDAQAAEIGSLRKTLAAVESENDVLRRVADYSGRGLRVPKWLTRVPKKNTHVATICVNLSDCHFDESVNPSELSGHNAYNREIAVMRLERFTTGTVKLARHHWAGATYDGVCLFLTGDIFSGIIHEELDATNDGDGPLESLHYWAGQVAGTVEAFANEFGRVHVPCVVGNHSRLDKRPRAKGYVRRNFEWLLYQSLGQHFDKDERVTFAITDDIEQVVDIHGYRFLQYHGMTGGGSGIGGIFPPLMRLTSRLRTRWGDFVAMVNGHWHQHIYAPEQGLLSNGSLKGYDEWARDQHFRPERPQQMVWLVTPEHGCTWAAPVFVQDRKAEGW